MNLELRALEATDKCNGLSLGLASFAPLKAFLRKEAKRLHFANLARTFVVVEEAQARVLAYVTMVCTRIAVQQFSDAQTSGQHVADDDPLTHYAAGDYRYADYPAVKLARLAVDTSLQGRGVGSRLVDLVLGLTVEHIVPHAGCRFMVVDAKADSVSFYKKKGFASLTATPAREGATTTMFLDLHRLAAVGRPTT